MENKALIYAKKLIDEELSSLAGDGVKFKTASFKSREGAELASASAVFSDKKNNQVVSIRVNENGEIDKVTAEFWHFKTKNFVRVDDDKVIPELKAIWEKAVSLQNTRVADSTVKQADEMEMDIEK